MKLLTTTIVALVAASVINVASANCGNEKDVGVGCSDSSSSVINNNTNNNSNYNANSNSNNNSNSNTNNNTNSNTNSNVNNNTANGGAGGAGGQGGNADAYAVAHGGEGGSASATGGNATANGGTSNSSSNSSSGGSSSSSSSNNNYTAGDTNVNLTQLPTLPLGYESVGGVSGSVATVSVQAYGGQNGGGIAAGIAIPLHGSEYSHAMHDAVQIQHVQMQTAELQMLSLCEAMKTQQKIVVPACAQLYQKYHGGF